MRICRVLSVTCCISTAAAVTSLLQGANIKACFLIFPDFLPLTVSFFSNLLLLAIIWIKDPFYHEISVNGLRQGVTKKNLSSPKAR